MKNISYIICAAGDGMRLKTISSEVPKPLLKLNSKTLLEWSLKSLPINAGDEIMFLHRLTSPFLEEVEQILVKLSQMFQIKVKIVRLSHPTRGQAETAYRAKNKIEHSRIVVFNIDTYFQSRLLSSALQDYEFDGVVPCYEASADTWSFFKADNQTPFFKVSEVQEKIRISNWCSAGFYFFKNADVFFAEVEKVINIVSIGKELDVAPFYNHLIRRDCDIRVVNCEVFKPMGTPEQVKAFWNLDGRAFKNEND